MALAAKLIAEHHPNLDPERTHTLGLLHDIGRRFGPNGGMHVLDGFNYLLANGYADAARIALIHSFALQDVTALQGYWDGVPADRTRLSELLGAVTYTDEDRLFQLCDILGGADGFCVLEEWLMEVALRIGMTERTLDKSERNWL